MKKKSLSLILSLILMISCVFCTSVTAFAKKGYVARSTSDLGVRFIEAFEGYFEYAYWDYEHYTIGYGTYCTKDEYPAGISEPFAHQLLVKKLPSYESGLNSFLKSNNIYVTQNQYDALISFTYNFGAYVWNQNPTIAKYLKKGIEKYTEKQIADAFGLWVKAGGQVLQGLVDRRAAEAKLFNTDDYSAAKEIYVVSGSVTIRKSPSYSSTSYGSFKKGDTVAVLQKRYIGTTTWGKVKYDGSNRWISLNDTKYANCQASGSSLIATCIYSAENASGGIKLTWKKVPGATGYKVYKKPDGESEFKLLKTIKKNSTVSYTDTSVSVSKTYHYYVSAYNADKTASKSGYVSISRVLTPSLKSLSKLSNGFKISWAKQSGATGYYVMRKGEGDSYYTRIATTTSTSYTNKTIVGGVKYHFAIKSYNSYGISGLSNDKSGMIMIAPEITSSTNSKSKITVKWTVSRGAACYYVYRKVNSGSLKKVATVKGTSYGDKSVKASKNYTYAVIAHCSAATSTYSNHFTTKLYAPPTMKSISSEANGLKIAWNSVSGVNKYKVYRRISTAKSYSELANTTSTSYTDTTAASGKKYYYKVASYHNGNRLSYKSDFKKATFYGSTNITSDVAVKDGLKLTWKKVDGAKSYSLYSYASKKYTLIVKQSENTYTDTSVKFDSSKKYALKVNYENGSSKYSDVYTAYRLATPKLTVTKSTNGLLLSWEKVKNAKGIIIYRKDPGEDKYKLYTKQESYDKTTFDNTTVKSGKTYGYYIKVIKGKSTSMASNKVSKKR